MRAASGSNENASRTGFLTFPFELRARLAHDRELFGGLTKIFDDSVLGFYRRALRDLYGVGSGEGGAINVMQRTSSDLRLNPHLHQLALDSVFVEDESGKLVFHPLPTLTNSDVADLLDVICIRMLALLERERVIDDRLDPRLADDGFAEREPALASLASAAVTGNMPAGPEELRQQAPERSRARRAAANRDRRERRSLRARTPARGGRAARQARDAPLRIPPVA